MRSVVPVRLPAGALDVDGLESCRSRGTYRIGGLPNAFAGMFNRMLALFIVQSA